jgi:hypothetical protein
MEYPPYVPSPIVLARKEGRKEERIKSSRSEFENLSKAKTQLRI